MSCTVSPMSCRSPSVRVIGSMNNFEAFAFFHNPIRFAGCWRFSYMEAVHWSAAPSSISASFAACPCEGVVWPLPTFTTTSCAGAAFSHLVAFYVTSHATYTSATIVYLLRFLANCVMRSLASSFFFCVADFLISAMSRAHHSNIHASRTLKMASLMAIKGSFVHCLVGPLCALIYMLCMSALNIAKFADCCKPWVTSTAAYGLSTFGCSSP